jgi:hypothetical protein
MESMTSGEGPLQIIAEFLMAAAVWIAAVVLAQFGVEVDLTRDPPPTVERVAERAQPAAIPCPDATQAAGKARRHAV